jgi:hypothetical protein
MEGLLNHFGMSAFWPVMVFVGLPLIAIGLVLRRRARRKADAAEAAVRAQRPIREVQAGTVTLVGLWRPVAGGGIVEEEPGSEHRVMVERAEGAPSIADGQMVLVVGCATRQADDPRPAGYRGSPRVWVVETSGDGQMVTPDTNALASAVKVSRAASALGAALFAAGIAIAAASAVIAWRAAHDSYDLSAYNASSADG